MPIIILILLIAFWDKIAAFCLAVIKMIAAIIVGLITGWIYTWFVKKKITIKLPDQVPPAVANSFVALIPSAILTVWFANCNEPNASYSILHHATTFCRFNLFIN